MRKRFAPTTQILKPLNTHAAGKLQANLAALFFVPGGAMD
jgi:hypothetical protein